MEKLSPKKLFLLDGFGALLSAFSLGVVLTTFQSTFGMPTRVLYILALVPCFFAVYDFVCLFRVTGNWRPFLQAIAIANLMYCVLSISFVFRHYQLLTALGLTYFVLEVVIVVLLASIELYVASHK